MKFGVHIIVKGMVQGVGFRYFVSHTANRLGLTGTVRNLYNGNVEIYSEGDRSIIEEFIKLVKVGPRFSNVTDLVIEWKEYTGKYKSFEIVF